MKGLFSIIEGPLVSGIVCTWLQNFINFYHLIHNLCWKLENSHGCPVFWTCPGPCRRSELGFTRSARATYRLVWSVEGDHAPHMWRPADPPPAGVDPQDQRAAAGALPPIDSLNMWPFLVESKASPREASENSLDSEKHLLSLNTWRKEPGTFQHSWSFHAVICCYVIHTNRVWGLRSEASSTWNATWGLRVFHGRRTCALKTLDAIENTNIEVVLDTDRLTATPPSHVFEQSFWRDHVARHL